MNGNWVVDIGLATLLAFAAGLGTAGILAGIFARVRRSVPRVAELGMVELPPRVAVVGPAAQAEPQFLRLAGASHELRTPLNGILGMAHLLTETELDQEQMAYVDAIRTAGTSLLSIVDDVLDAARMEAGHFEPVSEIFDVVTLVEGVTELLSPRAHEKGLAIAASVPAHLPRMVMGDPGRLRQALINLGGNAVKFTSTGSIGLYVSRNGEGKLELAVDDTGPGIPEEQRSAIFEAFAKGDAKGDATRQSTGLGLSITRNIIEHYRGSIEVRSRIGEGARFTVALDWRSESPAMTAASAPDLSGKTILIVAGDDHQRRILRDHLGSAGAKVNCIGSIASALKSIGQSAPDIVLVDGSFGAQAAELARVARHARVGRTIVLLSPNERRSFGQPRDMGFDAFLMKPVRTTSLFDRIETRVENPTTTDIAKPILSLSGRSILLAEDDPVSAHLLRRLLEKRGATVRVVSDASAALALVRQSVTGTAFDAAILDKVLPGGMSGLDLARSIRSHENRASLGAMRIVCCSADFGPEETRLALAAGCDDVMPKPVDPARLDTLLTAARPAVAQAA
jgi:signal transduction histidine kinase/CheY-like chemotaxis protein